jgi:outer membrane protein OmpA-like peptidoglycan-associated protein
MTRQAKYKKRNGSATRSTAKAAKAVKTKSRSAQPGIQSELLALQRSAGNKIVSQLLQESDDRKHNVNVMNPAVDAVLTSDGQPLESSTRESMEALFNEDFSNVRVHTDAEAAESARSVNALAYTAGEDVVFGSSQYKPHSKEGHELLAHELAHTVQQRNAGVSAPATGGTNISRAPMPGAAEPETISLFSSTIPAPVITRFGSTIVATVYFGKNNFLLDSRNYTALDKLSEELRYMAQPAVSVDGYASAEGKEDQNQRLSEMRRLTVVSTLGSKLIVPITFDGKGHGSADPAVEETGKKGSEIESQRAQNRRVTIVITSLATPKPADQFDKPEEAKPIKLFPEIDLTKPETPAEMGARMMREAAEAEKARAAQKKAAGGQSVNDLVWKKVDSVVDDLSKKLKIPEELRPYVKDGAHALIEKGVSTALDKALDQTPLNSNEKEAFKKALEAAAKTEPPK